MWKRFGKEPREQLWLVVGFVPAGVSDAWIFGVMDLCPDLLHCLGHPLRFGYGNNVVVGAMKDPDRGLADSLGCTQICSGRIGGCNFCKIVVGIPCGCGRADTAANYHESCGGSRILLSKMPCAIAPHG